jgi:hypothetical protein
MRWLAPALARVSLGANSHQRASYGPPRGYAAAMTDHPLRPKPKPPQQAGSVISLADRDQERRHEAARRLAEKHNAGPAPPPTLPPELLLQRLRRCWQPRDLIQAVSKFVVRRATRRAPSWPASSQACRNLR